MTTTNPQRQARGSSLRPRGGQPDPENGGRAGRPRHGAAGRQSATMPDGGTTAEILDRGTLPPTGLLLARPALLLVCALLGALIGFAVTGGGGYQASAVIEYPVTSQDGNVAKQTGQTLARTAVNQTVLDQAAAALQTTATDLSSRLSAKWETDTRLVTVTVTAPDERQAVDSANVVASTVITAAQAGRQAALTTALQDSTAVLNDQALPQADAELSRKTQLGAALGIRQDAIIGQTNALSVTDPATTATAAGLGRPIGAAIGLIAGLLLGGLAALLLGLRGLRVSPGRALRTLLPHTEVNTSGQVAKLAGECLDSRIDTVAIVAAPGMIAQSKTIGEELAGFIGAHGRRVMVIGPEQVQDRAAALGLLGRDVRADVMLQNGADLLVAVVVADSDAAALLEGQSDVRAHVVVESGRTTLSRTLHILESFSRARPTLVLAK